MPRVRVREIFFGDHPLVPALKQCADAVLGDGVSPASLWDLSSTQIFKPRISFPLWLGRRGRDVMIYNLPNRALASLDAGYSVRRTTCRDYRGRDLTYDSHVGTDFATPPGTEVVAAESGVVIEVRMDMQRGGLKVVIAHGEGLVTLSCHLSRSLVTPGQRVARGEVIALSGMSSVDGLLFFPWLAPHLHYTVMLDGQPVDPFPAIGEVSLWRTGDGFPTRTAGDEEPGHVQDAAWNESAVADTLSSCRAPALRRKLESLPSLRDRAVATSVATMLKRHAFEAHPTLVTRPSRRRPRLDLPLAGYRGVRYADDPAP